jgi:hypothetical protein
MSEERGTLRLIAEHLVGAVAPLHFAFRDVDSFRTLMGRLGWDALELPPAYTAIADKAQAAIDAVEALAGDADLAAIFAVIRKVGDLYRDISALSVAPPGVDAGEFLSEIGRRLFEYLLLEYLRNRLPRLLMIFEAIGVVAYEDKPPAGEGPGHTRHRFNWDAIPERLSDVRLIAADVYGWGADQLNFVKIVEIFSELCIALDLHVSIDRVGEKLSDAYLALATAPPKDSIRVAFTAALFDMTVNNEAHEVGFRVLELPAEGSALPGLIIQPMVPQGLAERVELAPNLAFNVRGGTDLAHQFGIVLRPGEIAVRYPFAPGATLPSAGFGVSLSYDGAEPFLLFGNPQGTRLEGKKTKISADLDLTQGQLELKGGVEPDDLTLVLKAADLDGFLGELLGSNDRAIPIVLGAQWSNRTGFNFTGGAGLEISTHPHLSLGPLRVECLDLAIKSTFDLGHPPDLKLQVGTELAGVIGPITFSADGLGVTLSVVFAEGNAGPFDIDYSFTPPKGLGIAVDAGPISGGGFLSFDKDRGRYAGAVELDVFSTSLKAIGFVETKLPNAARGYSFLILISTEFKPIQLGLGFTLNGVGGLIAMHRRLDVEALRAGMLAGSVDDVLYPKDPIGDAPRIISELAVLFPPAPNHFVFAPTALIGWGTPTIVRAELGIVFEPPSPLRVTLLGLISSTLPTEEVAIVKLHVAVLGKIDFVRLRLAIDAKLYDSNVAGYPLTGDMAVRVVWTFPPAIVVALGGLNPHFKPPPDFPALDRLTIVLGTGDNPKLTCQAYLAMTPNTLQFGVRAELYAAAAGFNIRGWVNFDCIIQRFPFSLRADIAGDVAFRRGERVLASVHLEASITGPVPWHLWGKASLSLWLFDVTVPFDVTFGLRRPLPLPSLNPWPLLQAAIEDLRNWSTALAKASLRAVTLSTFTGPSVPILMDPGGAPTLRQTVVPLNRKITRFGAAKPEGPDRYTVASVTMNGVSQAGFTLVTEYFAAAQFEDLTDTDKLSRPSFERMEAGVSLGPDVIVTGSSVGAKLEYETIILDAPWQRRSGPRYSVAQDLQLLMLEQGASAHAPFKSTGLNKFAAATPSKLKMDDELFAIASTVDATAVPTLTAATTKGAALAALADHLQAHPEDRGRLQVVSEYELGGTP